MRALRCLQRHLSGGCRGGMLMKIEIKMNGRSIRVDPGATLLEAAEMLGFDIPTLCYAKKCEPETSCMLCVVKNLLTGQLIPACSARAIDGMEIETECDEVESARRDILNLLLSEHVGDCEAPCTRVCPAHLDIPRMLREIERGNLDVAAWVARRDLALPASLGYVCPAPCETGCRRKDIDTPLSIRAAHLQVAEIFQPLESDVAELGKEVAVIGAGAAGLSGAWKLRQLGYDCTIYDVVPQAGGDLRNHANLPVDVLDAEINWLHQAGIKFKLGDPVFPDKIAKESDAVIFASAEEPATQQHNVFYAAEHRLTVKAVGNGKEAALQLHQAMTAELLSAIGKRFDSKTGRLRESELDQLKLNCSNAVHDSDLKDDAARCLHCDCRKPLSCKLRNYAEQYGADQRTFSGEKRVPILLIGPNDTVVFEPGKCIKCGLCIKITEEAGEELGLTFKGRGFNVQLVVPFGESLQAAIKSSAKTCVEICPTGALAFRSE